MKPVQAVQKAAIRLIGSIGKMKVKGLPRGLVIVLMLLIVGSAVLYLAGWGWIWAVGGRPDLPALNQLLQTLTSASFIAAAGFILRALIDADGDSIPDYLQKDNKEGESNESISQPGPCPEWHPGPRRYREPFAGK